MKPIEFARLIGSHDGVDAFNEASTAALARGAVGRVDIVVSAGPDVAAMAYATADAPVELAVHPSHRRRGHATALLERVLQLGETQFWAHGDTEGARGLAATFDLRASRTLLRLSRPARLHTAPGVVQIPPDVLIRTFRDDDLSGLLAVNAHAFATHPEQGAMDQANFEQRTAYDWFDPAGLFVAVRDGAIVGFHWTKVHRSGATGAVGEVYVLATDPASMGQGLGAALLRRGLDHLTELGVTDVELYVEADNNAALSLYRSFGFVEAGRDALYVSMTPASAAHGPS